MGNIVKGNGEQVLLDEGKMPVSDTCLVLSKGSKQAVISLFEGKKDSKKTVDEILAELDPPLGEASYQDLQIHWLNFHIRDKYDTADQMLDDIKILSAINDQMLLVLRPELPRASYEQLATYQNFSSPGGKLRKALENQKLIVLTPQLPSATYQELKKYWKISTEKGKLCKALEDQMLIVLTPQLPSATYQELKEYRKHSTDGGKLCKTIEKQLFDIASNPDLLTNGKTFSDKDIVEITNEIQKKSITNKKIANAFRSSFETLYNRIKGEEKNA